MKKTSLLWMGLLGLAMTANVAFAAPTVVVKGSTTVLPIAQATAEAYMKRHPDVNISISGGGSGDGIKALIDRSTDIADSSRDLKPEEIALAEKNGVKPLVHTVAIDAIVPIVNPKNKVGNLTIEQLSQIYKGEITNWKEVGGADMRIVVVSRDSSSGTFESWGELVLRKAKVTPKAQMQASNGAIVQTVSKNRYAIGYIGLGYINKSVKPVSVNGVTANAKTAISGAYPVSRPLYMVTNGEPRGAVADYLNFVKGKEGQKLVGKTGFVPLGKK
ncbi:MAG TPA: PstS family phosphate ABC transporter substrate-binding protein [Syntrophales bacterium]|nr:PstS family phosphate ABC transporter substrate-binding protein [Syntrophales bacterium]HPX56162.1 PstS family phosphate ABC transporter substrate-binding protein [Syntrophales bacterium]HQA82633.1 PstS family phosphate ABC transporter substrate-binding protein [Syntrophales bacterium]